MAEDHAIVTCDTRAEWRAWLAAHHGQSDTIWLAYPKKGAGLGDLTYDALVEEALCYGWIDSVARGGDARRSVIRMSPRKARSGWSATNKARVERLARDGRMTPAGTARVEAAKADGSWGLLDAAEALAVPPDLEEALAANAEARAHFAAFPPGVRKRILTWVTTAKRPETRARRVAETVALAARNVRAGQ
ncbi:YdeI/OmpD-associated family protein [Roseisolibacter sp. H3M3-2]|uniref:YdeI/OmpD-associated family protein n=1 Tax=Roseisolibacter sp. H3M3-2 TaxID=3031323 RepID=UPI0023DB5689|nr:YdeI/OmpD-associated family protein [Roseisolibacter sp. H3M3-2]MDF1505582.1 YdeI/OmpD-associated family protein [Roseisolibacter sp. H3M3-2]